MTERVTQKPLPQKPLPQKQRDERDEQVRLIRDSVAGLVAGRGGVGRARDLRYAKAGMDAAVWRELCELGLVGLRVPEERGGAGLGMAEYVAVAEELGRGLVPEPLIDASLAAALLDGEALAAQLAGERLILPAGFSLQPGTGQPLLDGQTLHGQAGPVPLGAAADAWLVASGEGPVLVARGDRVAVESRLQQDGSHLATLRFHGAPAVTVAAVDAHCPLEEAALAGAAYLLGVMNVAFDETVSYLKIRRQFGREIGGFQALQHRAVNLKIELELSRAMINAAADALDRNLPVEEQRRRVSTARAKVSSAALLVTREAVQFHGGIGYTDEANIGLFLRKVMVLLNRYGSVDFHKRRYAGLDAVVGAGAKTERVA